jgi:hypothetical protein
MAVKFSLRTSTLVFSPAVLFSAPIIAGFKAAVVPPLIGSLGAGSLANSPAESAGLVLATKLLSPLYSAAAPNGSSYKTPILKVSLISVFTP